MIWETILRMLYLLEPLLPMVLTAALLTVAVWAALVLPCSRFWVDSRKTGWLGLFLGLRGKGCVRLACAWLRCCLTLALLIPVSQLTALHCVVYAVPMLAGLWGDTAPGRVLGRLLGDAALFAGVLLANLLFGYWQGTGQSFVILSLCIVLSVFVLLFNLYLFLLELESISEDRQGTEKDCGASEMEECI